MERSLQRADNQRKRLVVGWFSFTCCEDSTILLTELLNDRLDEWKKVVEFRHMKALKTRNSLSGLDVAFVEGAISSDSQAEEARRIRENAKYVVAIGACACTGKPSTSRNQFVSEQLDERIQWYLSHSEGVVEDYDVIVPTAQNQINIENDLKDYFNRNLDEEEASLRADAESIVRAYDPCMSCATNFLKIDWIRR